MARNQVEKIGTAGFLLAELVLYILILTTGGEALVLCSFASILLCFAYAWTNLGRQNWLIPAGLACTVGADFFLVVCSPIRQLEGMLFFLMAQSFYGFLLHRTNKTKWLLYARAGALIGSIAVVFLILGEKTDALAVISLCYYANLIANILVSFHRFRKNRLLSIGFVLFLLCDTVIGLQMANGVYLTIAEQSLLHKILFVDFNLAWLFYLPSQVLIALSSRKHNQT